MSLGTDGRIHDHLNEPQEIVSGRTTYELLARILRWPTRRDVALDD